MPNTEPTPTRVTLTIKVVVDALPGRDPLNTLDDVLVRIDRAVQRAEEDERTIHRAFVVADLDDANVERND
jgi:hypothetical protein